MYHREKKLEIFSFLYSGLVGHDYVCTQFELHLVYYVIIVYHFLQILALWLSLSVKQTENYTSCQIKNSASVPQPLSRFQCFVFTVHLSLSHCPALLWVCCGVFQNCTSHLLLWCECVLVCLKIVHLIAFVLCVCFGLSQNCTSHLLLCCEWVVVCVSKWYILFAFVLCVVLCVSELYTPLLLCYVLCYVSQNCITRRFLC